MGLADLSDTFRLGEKSMIGPLAYMDPGTGSLFLQILLGGVAGFFVFLKLFWHRILSFFGLQKELQKTALEPQVDGERKS